MNNPTPNYSEDPWTDPEQTRETDMTQLWVVSYSDFMTILMIFFLVLFAHRVWQKKVSWETEKVRQMRAVRESQKGMIQRLTRLADVDVQAERIDINLPDALLFDAGRADLRDSARVMLHQLAPELTRFTGDIVVEGHTDNLAVGSHSPFQSNWELSVGRAFSVITCLVAQGVPPERLTARGYGEYRPRVLNDTPDHRAENRRIEIVLLNTQKGS
ncbi:MAG: flagellar motor protein MotB [Elusimicrobiota bacterium]|jgi:chemotaxis protein MotB